MAASLAQGAAALRAGAGKGSNGSGVGTGAAGTAAVADGRPDAARVPAAAAVGGSAILRGGPAAPPTARPMRESLGDEPVVSGAGAGASASGPKPGFTPSGARIGRNDPCWCGSGAKYKKCHGR